MSEQILTFFREMPERSLVLYRNVVVKHDGMCLMADVRNGCVLCPVVGIRGLLKSRKYLYPHEMTNNQVALSGPTWLPLNSNIFSTQSKYFLLVKVERS